MNTGRIFFIIFLAMVAVGIGGYFVVRGDLFPIAVVGGDVITQKTFKRHMEALSHYYAASKEQARVSELPIPETPPRAEMERATLVQLIEDSIIARHFPLIVGESGDAAITRKLADAEERMKKPEFEDSLRALYDLSVNEFRTLVLIPQAKRELVFDALREKNQDFNEWLRDAGRAASIHILLRGFAWNEGELRTANGK